MWSRWISWKLSRRLPEGAPQGPAALQGSVASLDLGVFNRKPKKKPFPTFLRNHRIVT